MDHRLCEQYRHTGSLRKLRADHVSLQPSGELKWEGGTFSDPGSSILTSDNRLIVWGGRGKLALGQYRGSFANCIQRVGQHR